MADTDVQVLSAYKRQKKNALANPLSPESPWHGTPNGYNNWHCKCDRCRKAWAKYHLAHMHADPERMIRAKLREKQRRIDIANKERE